MGMGWEWERKFHSHGNRENLIVPPKENAVCTTAILDFFVISPSLRIMLLNHFRKCFGS